MHVHVYTAKHVYFTYARPYLLITTRAARVVLFLAVPVIVILSVCLSVNAITPEPLEISSRNCQGIVLRSIGRASSKMTIHMGARVVI